MNGHTPGPWQVTDRHPARACLDIRTETDSAIASLYVAPGDQADSDADGVYRNDPGRCANARLIAAAPDMFQMLQDAYMVICNEVADGEDTPLAISIRELVAKVIA